MRDVGRNLKKERKKGENEERLRILREEDEKNEHISYGLYHNTFLLRVYDATITEFHNHKLIRAMMFDQKLIFDCSYDKYMNPREASNAGKQLMLSFAENRLHDEPFDLHLCNVNPRSISTKILEKFIPTMYNNDFPINIHTEPITEKFDKEKLVYLTPHCTNDLVEYNHDDIYIIGAMVDKTNAEPLSLAKAKKQGLRMARLPLDRYLAWGAGSGKSLTLNQMVCILLEMKKHGDWNQALRFVPKRKICDESERNSRTNYNQSRPYQPKQRFDNRDGYNVEQDRPTRSYQNRRFDDRKDFNSDQDRRFDDRQDFNSDRNRRFDNRQNFNADQDRQFDNRQSFNSGRQNYRYNNRQDFQPESRRPSYEERDSGNRQQFSDKRFDNRQEFPKRSYNNKSNSFEVRKLFEDEQNDAQPFAFDRKRSEKERKHFDKFKFDLDTWGSKTKNDDKNSKDS